MIYNAQVVHDSVFLPSVDKDTGLTGGWTLSGSSSPGTLPVKWHNRASIDVRQVRQMRQVVEVSHARRLLTGAR